MPRQETSRYYERCLRQLEQLEEMLATSAIKPNMYLVVRIGALAHVMQEERERAYQTGS